MSSWREWMRLIVCQTTVTRYPIVYQILHIIIEFIHCLVVDVSRDIFFSQSIRCQKKHTFSVFETKYIVRQFGSIFLSHCGRGGHHWTNFISITFPTDMRYYEFIEISVNEKIKSQKLFGLNTPPPLAETIHYPNMIESHRTSDGWIFATSGEQRTKIHGRIFIGL